MIYNIYMPASSKYIVEESMMVAKIMTPIIDRIEVALLIKTEKGR